jgi:hypothetical protein
MSKKICSYISYLCIPFFVLGAGAQAVTTNDGSNRIPKFSSATSVVNPAIIENNGTVQVPQGNQEPPRPQGPPGAAAQSSAVCIQLTNSSTNRVADWNYAIRLVSKRLVSSTQATPTCLSCFRAEQQCVRGCAGSGDSACLTACDDALHACEAICQ